MTDITQPCHIVTSRALTLAGRKGTFAIGPSPGIKDLWQSLMVDFGKIEGQIGLHAYGVCFNFDGTPESGGHMDYLAVVQVANAGAVPGYLHTMIIPARKVAVFTHQGDMVTLSETWARIFAEGLPEAMLKVADGPQFEVYDYSSGDYGGTVEIHVPVK